MSTSTAEMNQSQPTLTVCICTIDRPDVLDRCLAAIAAGKRQPDAVIVSDDSSDGSASGWVCSKYPLVRYMSGPRRGLCANRNVVIAEAKTDYVALLDDDAVVSGTFVSRAYELIGVNSADVILTGSVIEDGKTIVAANPSFLGYFTDTSSTLRKNINLNCNVIPRKAFSAACFDENIGYGYEDMDLCSRLTSLGYTIRYEPSLTNTHLPPVKPQREQRKRFTQANRARFYTSVKRYLLWEKSPLKLVAFVFYAPMHRFALDAKTRRWYDVPHCISDMLFALSTSVREGRRLHELPR